jgi:hypothetical protein
MGDRAFDKPRTFADILGAELRGLEKSFMVIASLMVAGNAVFGIFGVAYWWLSARIFAPDVVGFASARVSVMRLAAVLAEIGVGTLLMGEALRHRERVKGLSAAALIAATLAASVIGIGYFGLASALCHQGHGLFRGADNVVLFGLGCAVTARATVLDSALAGLGRRLAGILSVHQILGTTCKITRPDFRLLGSGIHICMLVVISVEAIFMLSRYCIRGGFGYA